MINKSKIIKDAQKFVSKGQVDKAIAEYAKIVKDNPNDTTTHNIIGDLHLKTGNKSQAIISFKAAADVLNKDGFALKAIALYKKVLNINPEQVDVQLQMGKLNAERGMLGNANENYLEAAKYFTKQGKKDRVLEVYKTLCNLNPDNIALAQKLAELYMSEGMVSEALAKFIQLAERKVSDGDLQTARQLLDKVRSKGSTRDDFIKVSALIDLKEGRLPEAVSQLEELMNLEHTNVDTGMLLSDAYVMSGRYEDAATALEKLLKDNSTNVELRKKLIDVLIKSGDYSAAWEQYRVLVDAHIDKNEHNKAEKLVQEYLSHNEDSIEARQVLVDLYSNIGRQDRITELHAEIAGLYAKSGEYEKARNIYTKLLEKDAENEEYKSALEALDNPPETAAAEEEPGTAEEAVSEEPSGTDEPVASEEPAVTEEPAFSDETVVQEKETQEEPDTFEFDEGSAEEGEEELVTTSEGIELPVSEDEGEEEPAPAGTGIDLSVSKDEGGEESLFAAGEPPSGIEREFEFTPDAFGEEEEPEQEGTGGIYDLSETPEDLPPLDLSGGAGINIDDIPIFDDSAYEPAGETADDMGGLDIFTSEDQEEESAGEEGEIRLVSGSEGIDISELREPEVSSPEPDEEEIASPAYELPSSDTALEEEQPATEAEAAPEPPADYLTSYEEPSAFEERLTEVDVYIKYGLFPKAMEALSALEATNPAKPEIYARYMELSRAEGNMDSFVERSIQLIGIYKLRGMENEAEDVLEDALALCPDDERLAQIGQGEASGEEQAEAGTRLEDEEFEGAAESVFEEEEMSGMAAGSVGFFEELAEADFYAQQGLVKEAGAIYRRLLASDPENDAIREKYEKLQEAAAAAEEEPAEAVETTEESFAGLEDETSFADLDMEETPAGGGENAVEPASELDNELDEAFSDMGLDEEAEEEPAHAAVAETVELESEPVEEAEEDEGFFDLAAELRDEIGADIISPSSGSLGDGGLDAVFQEFKKGVNDQLSHEDYDTHYNLGIAYKEMGMIDDALSEFGQASQDPSRTLDCASMLGLCYIEKGEYDKAIEHFKRGLAVKNRDKEEYLGLKYDMATAYELSGDLASAFEMVSDIHGQDDNFRDVKKRFQRLEKSAGSSGEKGKGGEGGASKSKKSKVSYL